MKRPVAVLGVGQTQHSARRSDVSIAGLVREAASRALADAGLDYSDIDAIVFGKAPDMLEGVMQPEQYLVGAVGGHLKPMIRVHTAGSVGASTALAAVTHVTSGLFERVLTIAWEKQSEGNAMWALSPNMPFTPPLVAGAGGYFAPYVRAYVARTGCPPHIGPLTAVSSRDNATRNEYAHLREPMTLDDVLQSPVLWDPIRYGETCPSSDGACAMVIGSEDAAKKAPRKVAWIRSGAALAESMFRPGRDQVDPAAGRACAKKVYDAAGITDPWNQIDTAEIYVPFAWFEAMWLENLGFREIGEGWKAVERGDVKFDGHLPINPSGGVLASNPIGASGMLRFGEAALQVMGRAGAHQVEGAKIAMGHAYGGGAQYFAMWIVSSER
jgi:acetyl-CoA C-acetyltransferase